MNYAKAIAQVVATVLAAIIALPLGNGDIDPREWVNVVLLGLGACAVFYGPEVPHARITKTVVSALAAAAVVFQSVIPGGVTITEWGQIVIAVLGALGVHVVTNKTKFDRV